MRVRLEEGWRLVPESRNDVVTWSDDPGAYAPGVRPTEVVVDGEVVVRDGHVTRVEMAAFLASTTRIKVGSGVVSMWTRNPTLLASTFATLDDLAPGRVMLGIGAWWGAPRSQGRRRPAPAAAGHA